MKTTDHQAPDFGIGATGIFRAKVDIAGLVSCQSDLLIEPRPSLRRNFPLKRIADLVLRPWTQFDGDQFLGARAQAPTDVVAGDYKVGPCLIDSPNKKMDVRLSVFQ